MAGCHTVRLLIVRLANDSISYTSTLHTRPISTIFLDFASVQSGGGGAVNTVDTTVQQYYCTVLYVFHRNLLAVRSSYMCVLFCVYCGCIGQRVFQGSGATRERWNTNRRIRETMSCWIRHAAHSKAQRGETQPEAVAGGALAGKKSSSSWYDMYAGTRRSLSYHTYSSRLLA